MVGQFIEPLVQGQTTGLSPLAVVLSAILWTALWGPMGLLLAAGVLVGGFLVVAALVLLWRSFCELYVALFRLSDDLHAIRQATDAEYSVKSQQPKR